MATELVAARVARGVEVLDREYPGWAAVIDVAELNMTAANMCVLGQLFGLYTVGLTWLSNRGHIWLMVRPAHLGFEAAGSPVDGNVRAEYDELTAAWAEAARERRQGGE